MNQTGEFLWAIWRPVGYGEIRVIQPRVKVVQQHFIPLGEEGIDAATALVDDQMKTGGADIYFGVVPRLRRGGKSADVLPSTDVLWADIDGKAHPGGKTGAYNALTTYLIRPSILVDSGNGYHAYWLLRDLVPFEEASLAMKAIARAVGGDHTHDAARVLRIPGTTNYKNADDLLPVRLVAFSERRFRWSDFDWEVATETRHTYHESVAPLDASKLPEWLTDLIQNGAAQGARSEAAFKVCLWLCRFGWTDSEIFSVFQNHPNGIGAKYHERKDGERWLLVTLTAARTRA